MNTMQSTKKMKIICIAGELVDCLLSEIKIVMCVVISTCMTMTICDSSQCFLFQGSDIIGVFYFLLYIKHIRVFEQRASIL